MRKETVDIRGKKQLRDILITSRKGGQKNHAIYQSNEHTALKNKEVEPGEFR